MLITRNEKIILKKLVHFLNLNNTKITKSKVFMEVVTIVEDPNVFHVNFKLSRNT